MPPLSLGFSQWNCEKIQTLQRASESSALFSLPRCGFQNSLLPFPWQFFLGSTSQYLHDFTYLGGQTHVLLW